MNRIHSNETETVFPVVVVTGALIVGGLRVMALIDHDAAEIRLSSLVPVYQRAEAVRHADLIARRDLDRPGPFADALRTTDNGGYVVHPAVYRAPHRPDVRAGVKREFAAYSVPGVVRVESFPHRPLKSARALCRRVYRDPSYLDVIKALALPGVTVTAPKSRRARRVA